MPVAGKIAHHGEIPGRIPRVDALAMRPGFEQGHAVLCAGEERTMGTTYQDQCFQAGPLLARMYLL